MKITKLVHSCLLIEEEDTTILIDPGEYSVKENVLSVDAINKLDYLLITHEHADHFSLPIIKELIQKFPALQIITNSSLQALLEKEGIKASSQSLDFLQMVPASHEPILLAPVPDNALFRIISTLTHPGDSYDFTQSTPVLAMPLIAPWGSMVQGLKKVLETKPKVVIPIHDWHWKDEAKKGMYPRIKDYLKEQNITFLIPENGTPFEV